MPDKKESICCGKDGWREAPPILSYLALPTNARFLVRNNDN